MIYDKSAQKDNSPKTIISFVMNGLYGPKNEHIETIEPAMRISKYHCAMSQSISRATDSYGYWVIFTCTRQKQLVDANV